MNPLTAGSTTAGSGILASLGNNSTLINSIQTQLSTNQKVLDPAQQGVVTRLTSQVTSYAAAHNNIAKAQNVLNVAKTGLTSIASLLTQMQDLANKANDATMTTADAAKLNQTFQNLLKQVTSTASASKVDSVGLLGPGSTSLAIQTGLTNTDTTTISGVNSTAADLIPAGTNGSSNAVAAAAAIAASNATAVTANAAVASAAGLAAGPVGTAANAAAAAASNAAAITANTAVANAAGAIAGGAATATVAGALDISTTASAAAAITALSLALNTVSTNQSSVAADQLALTTVDSTDASISQNLQNTIDSIQKPDAAALQIQLQNANNQQSMNYYLINQMNTEASAVLTIFR